MAKENGYQKITLAVDQIVYDLLSSKAGDKTSPMEYYQTSLGVSRGTVKNAFDVLSSSGAVRFSRHGHAGTVVEAIDYKALQTLSQEREILGIMPLPYSMRYEGLATAIYEQLSDLRFNMVYTRGAVDRLRMVESGTFHFAITSRYAAERHMSEGMDIEVASTFGPKSYLSSHILLFREGTHEITDGMKVAYDENSLDQKGITEVMTSGLSVVYVPVRTQQTAAALRNGTIDAGVWNLDALEGSRDTDGLEIVEIPEDKYSSAFTEAAAVVRKGNAAVKRLIASRLDEERTMRIMDEVMHKTRSVFY